jgi:formylglycine-generating enzyme required for sulfatase activity
MTVAGAPNLARIPAGEFLMGAPDRNEDERPLHPVFLSEFFIGRYPVTCDEYSRFVRATGYPAPAVRDPPAVASSGDDDLDAFRTLAAQYVWEDEAPPAGHGANPVVLVTSDDAAAYCAWMSDTLSRTVRLPTEAEWEKAARGGVANQRYPWGNEIEPTSCVYLSDPEAKRERGTRPTGTYAPNGYGLYDMAGNVWEWVSDWYDPDYYSLSDLKDPRGPQSGALRIVRGGSWVNHDVEMLRCAYRHKVPPDTYTYSIGFRIVCTD